MAARGYQPFRILHLLVLLLAFVSIDSHAALSVRKNACRTVFHTLNTQVTCSITGISSLVTCKQYGALSTQCYSNLAESNLGGTVTSNAPATLKHIYFPSVTLTNPDRVCANDSVGNAFCWTLSWSGDLFYGEGFAIAPADIDNDGAPDWSDNCPTNSNVDQLNTDGDAQGDACDADDDNDGIADTADKFPLDATKSKFVRHDTESDGDSDVLIRSASTGSWTRYGIQNNTVIDAAVMNAPTSSDSVYVAQLDANGDGDADILTRSASTGAWTLSIVESGAVTSSVPLYLYASLGYVFVGTGDFNNDGVDDVMLRHATNGYRVFLLENHAVSSSVYYNAWTAASSVDQGIGDFNGDGTDDLLVRRTSDNLYFIFKTINGAVSNYYCACNLWANPDWTFQFAGDTNKDGIDDIVIRGTGASADGKWWAFRMNNFSSALTTNLNMFLNKTAVTVGSVGDYNGDGTIDVLTRVNNSTTYVSPIMNGTVTGNYWLYNFTADQVIGK